MTDFQRSIRDAYDEIAADHDEHRNEAAPEMTLVRDLVEDLSEDAHVPENPHVLNAGCGAGDPIGSFLTEHARATGLDFSRGQLDIAGERAPKMARVRGPYRVAVRYWDLRRAPFHLRRHPRPARAPRAVLRGVPPGLPGRRAVLVTVGTTEWVGSQEDWMGMGAEMHWDIPGEERTRELMERVGFTVEEVTVVEDPVSEEDGVKAFVRARA